MTKHTRKDYASPECCGVSIAPQAQILQTISNLDPVTIDAFTIYDDISDPYFG